jgi:hypothetical protein
MAQTGFPWQSASQLREPTYLDEKATTEPVRTESVTPKIPVPLWDASNNKATAQHHGRLHSLSVGKRRAVSIKPPVVDRPIPQPILKSRPGREAPGQLHVRTIPRKEMLSIFRDTH